MNRQGRPMRRTLELLSVASAAALLALSACTPRTDSSRQNTDQADAKPLNPPVVTEVPAGDVARAMAPKAPAVAQVISVEAPEAAQMAPNFAWRAADGTVHTLKEYRGKVVMLNFWATWCPPCRRELPDIVKVRQELAGKGFEVIGISVAERPPVGTSAADHVANFAAGNGLNYPLLIATDELIGAFGDISAVPTSFIIDRNGKIVETIVGGRDLETFRTSLQPLL